MFVTEREKYIWRTWEFGESDWLRKLKLKYNCLDGNFTDKQLYEIYYEQLREVTVLEQRYDKMMADFTYSGLINSDMQHFLTDQLGHHAWISITKSLGY